MDSTTFFQELQSLMAGKVKDKKQLQAAAKAAFLMMAHYIDLPGAEASGMITVTSGTAAYDVTDATMTPPNVDVDRITAAVFVGSTVQQPLVDWNIRQYYHHYYGQSSSARSGKPIAYCFHNGQFLLYKNPDESGSIYFSCQRVLQDIIEFTDNYHPLMLELTKLHLADPGSEVWGTAWHQAKNLIKSFKGKMHPKKALMEMGTHRSQRVVDLNNAR
jgi:hypothetical protein